MDVPQAAACRGVTAGQMDVRREVFPVIAALAALGCSAAVWRLLFRQEGGWEARMRVGGWLQ